MGTPCGSLPASLRACQSPAPDWGFCEGLGPAQVFVCPCLWPRIPASGPQTRERVYLSGFYSLLGKYRRSLAIYVLIFFFLNSAPSLNCLVLFKKCFILLKKFFFSLLFGCAGSFYCKEAFSSCGGQGLLFIEVHRLLIAAASLVVEHRL